MKKALSLAMAAAMTMGLAACGSTASSTAAADSTPASSTAESEETSAAESTDDKVYTVGICQLVQHEALDAATQGFKDALTEKLGEGSVTFDEQNASGDSANCTTIVNGFVSDERGSDPGQRHRRRCRLLPPATADIPVLGTSVTDYATALDICDWTGTVGQQHLRHLRPGAAGPAGCHDPGAVPGRQERSACCTAPPSPTPSIRCDVIEGYLTEMGYDTAPLRLHRHQRRYLCDPDRLRQPPT